MTVVERAWTAKPLTQLTELFKLDLETVDPQSCLNINPENWSWQIFPEERKFQKVGKDRFHPYCRFAPEYLTAEQVLARVQEWVALKFSWESELVDFRQIRIVKMKDGYLWCSQRMEHYPRPYLHKELGRAAMRLGIKAKPYKN
jgi:hypothetical protein